MLWGELIEMEPIAIFVLTARNVLFIGIFAWFLKNRKTLSAEYGM